MTADPDAVVSVAPTELPMSGGELWVTGAGFSNLTGAMRVTVGGAECQGEWTSEDGSTLVCVVPPRTNPADVDQPQDVLVYTAEQQSPDVKTVTFSKSSLVLCCPDLTLNPEYELVLIQHQPLCSYYAELTAVNML